MLLCVVFNVCFRNCLVPTLWCKAMMIKPIQKGANKDPFVPLNYKVISLISCVSKAYSALLNNNIVGYCNILDICVDEQNGFWMNKTYIGHT